MRTYEPSSRNPFRMRTSKKHRRWGWAFPASSSPLPHSTSVLCFQALAHSFALFCTFLHSHKTQLVSFQAIPHSLPKKRGVGRGPFYLDHSNTLQQETSASTLCFSCNSPGCR